MRLILQDGLLAIEEDSLVAHRRTGERRYSLSDHCRFHNEEMVMWMEMWM